MSDQAEQLKVIEGEGEGEPSQDPLVGQTIDGRYYIEAVLGEGGMGLVYRAKHSILNKPLALKVLRPDVSKDEQIITRFRQEAQSASAIGNEHIIDISDFGTLDDGSTYFVMEYLQGIDLTKAIETQRPFPPERTVYIAKQIARALGAAHDRGIVHRDLKPDNIFLVQRGEFQDFVKVLDFGIAKVGGNASKLTRAGQVFGTPHYMSPEQCAGTGVDHRTDVYALGVILYEMVTGVCPFDADNMMGILTKHLYEDPVPPSQVENVDIPKPLETLILRCITKQADDRYQTMNDVIADLERIEKGTGPQTVPASKSSAEQASVDVVPGVPRSRLPLLLGLAGAVVVLAAGGGAALVVSGGVLQGSSSESGSADQASRGTADSEGTGDGAEGTGSGSSGGGQGDTKVLPGQKAHTEQSGSSKTAKVTIESEPEGTEVWRGSSLLGNTPVELPRPDEDDHLDLELRKSGYKSQKVRISPLTAEEVTVTLDKKPKPESKSKDDSAEEEQERDDRAARRAARRRQARREAQRRRQRQQAQQQEESSSSSEDNASSSGSDEDQGSNKEPSRPMPSLPQSEVVDPWAQ